MPTGQVSFRANGTPLASVAFQSFGIVVTQIASGQSHNCALTGQGEVWCWGSNEFGELGSGESVADNPFSAVPVAVPGLSGVISLSAGASHTCAALDTGEVRCWGRNLHGELGTGDGAMRRSPVTVGNLGGVQQVAAGGYTSCARQTSGRVVCWGWGRSGQLGNGEALSRTAPVPVSDLDTAVHVGLGDQHACAVLNDGTVACWGENSDGQLGNGDEWFENSYVPVMAAGLETAVEVTAGAMHSCAREASGQVSCWGFNAQGQLGIGSEFGTDRRSRPEPVAVPGLDNAISLAAGHLHSCAMLSDGTARCWGDGVLGGLGDGENANSLVPVQVSGLSEGLLVSAGSEFSCAGLSDGRAQCWGRGSFGILGNNDPDGNDNPDGWDSSVPVDVAGTGGWADAVLTTDSLQPGTYSLTAHFPGGNGHSGSSSAEVEHVVMAPDPAFMGGGTLFGQTDACEPALGREPHAITIRYAPSELGGLPSGLSLVWPEGSEHLVLWGAMAPSADFLGGAGRQSWGRFVFYPNRPRMRVVTRQVTRPAGAPLMQAQELVLRLRTQNFASVPGCAVTIAAVLRRGE